MHKLIILMTVVLVLAVPSIIFVENAVQDGEESDGTLRGLMMIVVGMQFPPIGYGIIKKSFLMAENKNDDNSTKTLSNFLKFGVLLVIFGVSLILGGIGHIL